jgi:hypothetical protein
VEYPQSDPAPSTQSDFSPVDIVDDDMVRDDVDVDVDVGYAVGDDRLVPDDDEMVIVSDEAVIVTDDIVIVAENASAVGPAVVGPAVTGRAAIDPSADSEMAASEIELALEEIERELVEVERALERLGDGSYGRCETCGGVLSDEELESGPAARFCRAHLPFQSD